MKRPSYDYIDFPLAADGQQPVPRQMSKVYDAMGKEIGFRISVQGDFAPPVEIRFFEMTPDQMARILKFDLIKQDQAARREIQRRYRIKQRHERGQGQAA